MGNVNCFGKRKPDNMVEESMLQQINSIKNVPHDHTNNQKLPDKSIYELLKLIDLNQDELTKSDEQSQQERKSIPQLDLELNDIFSENLITEIFMKTDYDINPLDGFTEILDEKKKPPCLKVYLKQVEYQGNKINVTRSDFIVPCQPKQFIEYMGDFKEQKELDTRIDQFFPISQNNEQMETKIYLSYKKIVMISPRDFVYHKKTKIMDEVKEIWCDASKSVQDKRYPPGQKVRGEIILSGYVIQPLNNIIEDDQYKERFKHLEFKSDNYSFVKMYSECDFKMSAPFFMAKGQVGSEMSKYINAVYKALQ